MATGGRLRYWVSSCFILIASHVFFLMLRGVGGWKQTKPNLSLPGRSLRSASAVAIR